MVSWVVLEIKTLFNWGSRTVFSDPREAEQSLRKLLNGLWGVLEGSGLVFGDRRGAMQAFRKLLDGLWVVLGGPNS